MIDYLEVLHRVLLINSDPVSSIHHLSKLLALTGSIHCCWQANERPMLDLPTKQYHHPQGSE